MPVWLRWTFGLAIAAAVVGVPIVHYRSVYAHAKRLRVVVPGKVYRSGQLTVEGLTEAVQRYHLRTIVNLQDEYPDPDLEKSYFNRDTVKEAELCRQLGVRYVHIQPDLIPRRQVPEHRPKAIDELLLLLDDPANYPVLLHCKAGLHRTGVLVAVYRMEYQGWSPQEAIRELKANGFGEATCHSANDYITQYVLTFRRGVRNVPDGGEVR
jgi:protein tyrosine/serine phosphatase